MYWTYSTSKWSKEANFSLSMQLPITSKYSIDSWGSNPSMKKRNKWEWVPCITSIHWLTILLCWFSFKLDASINGKRFLSSSSKCWLQLFCKNRQINNQTPKCVLSMSYISLLHFPFSVRPIKLHFQSGWSWDLKGH